MGILSLDMSPIYMSQAYFLFPCQKHEVYLLAIELHTAMLLALRDELFLHLLYIEVYPAILLTITLTSPCILDSRKPHLYIAKLGFSGVFIISSIFAFLLNFNGFLFHICFNVAF